MAYLNRLLQIFVLIVKLAPFICCLIPVLLNTLRLWKVFSDDKDRPNRYLLEKEYTNRPDAEDIEVSSFSSKLPCQTWTTQLFWHNNPLISLDGYPFPIWCRCYLPMKNRSQRKGKVCLTKRQASSLRLIGSWRLCDHFDLWIYMFDSPNLFF